MEEQGYVCGGCGADLTAAGAVEVRQVEYHAYAGRVSFDGGEPRVVGDIATDEASDADGRYAMCGRCYRVVDLPTDLM